jgi:glycerol-3-phosphate dehydrogenase (NAD(P)+)
VKIGVVGAGAWGTTLANLLAGNGHAVRLWAYEPEVVEAVNRSHENPVFLAGQRLHQQVTATGDIADAVGQAEVVVSAAPCHVVRALMSRAAPAVRSGALVVSVSKGLDPERLETMTQVLGEVLPGSVSVAALSGPSFASEVCQRQPTAVVAASRTEGAAKRAQQVFAASYFRVYSHHDVLGVELGGALKNVIALAAGILEGLGLGNNPRAALITRGLAEVTRLGVAAGAEARTFAGLTGMGDLILTATSQLSRNRTLGTEIGRGKTLAQAQEGRKTVAEGVSTARLAVQLGERHGVELPIAQEVTEILFQSKAPRRAIEDLMERELKPENWQ